MATKKKSKRKCDIDDIADVDDKIDEALKPLDGCTNESNKSNNDDDDDDEKVDSDSVDSNTEDDGDETEADNKGGDGQPTVLQINMDNIKLNILRRISADQIDVPMTEEQLDDAIMYGVSRLSDLAFEYIYDILMRYQQQVAFTTQMMSAHMPPQDRIGYDMGEYEYDDDDDDDEYDTLKQFRLKSKSRTNVKSTAYKAPTIGMCNRVGLSRR